MASILIVDDSSAMRSVIKRIIAISGFEIDTLSRSPAMAKTRFQLCESKLVDLENQRHQYAAHGW